ncbi:DUF2247 family protein [Acetonema longum]|uniref:DUF2247 domain-containing protein n=1 Tax=Acetonema longum DSM 6540 TaxID=1009370 RepID=F7NGF5_9FIRM|nr:DUF2247 family protein [Acetonema longum]EGO64878.1 hypothetical protein ALO_05695 [Acetonema longum DSM 6540]
MDSLIFELKYDFVSKRVQLTWKDILYAINRKLLPSDSAIEHATVKVSQGEEYNQTLLDLASLYKGESVQPYLDELARLDSGQDDTILNEKWLYLVLDWVFENKDNYADPLGIVEQIYADFDYPEVIASFVRYMPSDEPPLGTLELNEARLYEKWKDYLDIQRKRFSDTNFS